MEWDAPTSLNSKAILHYGTVDCATCTPRTVIKGSAVEIEMFRPERTWQSAMPEQQVKVGANSFSLTGLRHARTHHFRLFVTHHEGKSRACESGTFKTNN